MPLLESADWPAVRALLDVGLTADVLPDATIERDVFWGAAEREVLRLDPDALARTGDELKAARSAAMAFLAASLAPSVPRLTREDTDGYSYTADVAKWDALAASLRARATREIGAYLEEDDSAIRRPTFFAAASGRRGV